VTALAPTPGAAWRSIHRVGNTRFFAARLLCLLAAMVAFLAAGPAFAQTMATYTSPTDGTVSFSATPCSNPLVRNFTVSDNFTVANIDLGIYVEHNNRGDLRMILQSPAGTRVQVVNGNNASITGNNFNVRLDDGASQTVNTDSTTSNHSTTAPPPFANTFRPNNALSTFHGESSNGTWRLEICDMFSSTNGNFRHAELYLYRDYADLQLSKSVNNASPASGSSVTFTLTLTNNSASWGTATNVEVTDLLPAGLSFSSYSGYGTYTAGTGVWQVPSIAPNQSRALTITATVTASAGAPLTNSAEVTSSPLPDPDSTPGNASTSEDDDASASLTVSGTRTAGTLPSLSCPAGTLLFNWDTRSWTSGSTSNNYTLTGLGTVGFSIVNPGTWLNELGGQTPRLTNQATGGFTPAQLSLAESVNLANRTQVVTTTITLPNVVSGLQFRIFDVDFGASQFADRVRVTGTLAGSGVTPTLTNGVSNYVIGNQAFGDTSNTETSAGGNVGVTFSSPVDTITIEYGNHSAAPTDPGTQWITIHDITFCTPFADVSVTKTSTLLSDPIRGTTNPLMIPGATVRYCVLISNAGPSNAASVNGIDLIPSTTTYVPGSMLSGTTCAGAATAEDDNASGADESNPMGASVSGSTLTIVGPALNSGSAIALTYRATVN
jgi:uncharacterized repeat protein (TIGR01451 family)